MKISFCRSKIQYFYIAVAIVSLCFAVVSHVSAQGVGGAPGGQSTERRAGLPIELQNRTINLVRNIANKMTSAIDRLDNISGRIEARIAILETEGIETSVAKEKLALAESKLTEARAALEAARADAEDALISDTPRELFPEARAQFTAVRALIRDAYIALRESVLILKDNVQTAELNRGVSSAVTDAPKMNAPEVTNTPR